MIIVKSRSLFSGILAFVSASIAFALYIQYFQNIAPCPLCMLQRVIYIFIALTALIAVLHNPHIRTVRVYGIISMVFALIGMALAGRHVWLESLPPDLAPACGPSLEIMLDYLPLFEVIKTIISGTGDCAKVAWSFLGLSMAYWSLTGFAIIFIVSLSIMLKPVGRF